MKVKGLIDHVIFGPVDSRRYGRSLGINPLPPDVKLCNFNCPYCECGWTDVKASRKAEKSLFPPVDLIEEALRGVLEEVRRNGPPIDNITVAGNGEPTMHPEFPKLVDRLLAVREELQPEAGLIILANSTNLDRPEIVEALSRLDEQVMKLDAGTNETFRKIALPMRPMTLEEICKALVQLPRVVIQAMFVEGRICNTGEAEIAAWLERLRQIQPNRVQVYSIDRKAADTRLQRVSPEMLQHIARRVEQETGIPAEVFI